MSEFGLSNVVDVAKKIAESRASMGFKLFEPYPLQTEFVRQSAIQDNLLLSGANRTGKTSLVGRYLLPVWLTGDYPENWEGRRWRRPIVAWVGSTDWSTNIYGCQMALLGEVHKGKEYAGKAYWDASEGRFISPGIPAASIERVEMNPHVTGSVLRAFVRNEHGGISEVRFISYLQGRERLQAGKVDVVWEDEEPPEDVHTELAARTIDSAGLSILSFTPIKGLTPVVRSFIGDAQIDEKMPSVLTGSRGVLVRMSAYDVPHLTSEKIASMKRRYPKYQWPARIHGVPALGEGAIYPFEQDYLEIPAFDIPRHWKVLDAVDFGFQHPTARVRGYMNPDTKEIFIAKEYKDNLKSPAQHAREWEKQFTGFVRVVWPHDGRNTETDGQTKKAKYEQMGVRFTPEHVRMPGQTSSVMSLEGSIQLVYDHMQEGKLKFFQGLVNIMAELRLYRREKKLNQTVAKVVKENDDLMDAVRYCVCGLLSGMGMVIDTAFTTGDRRDEYQDWALSHSVSPLDFDPRDF